MRIQNKLDDLQKQSETSEMTSGNDWPVSSSAEREQ